MAVMVLGKSGAVGGLIVFGTTTSLFAKIVYELKSVGSDGTEKYFHKPWAMTAVMFIGMTFCLPLAYIKRGEKREGGDAEEPLLGGQAEAAPKRNELKETLLLSIPTFFDLLATVLMNVGLLYVTASVYQMMRGAEMLFAAGFAVTFLKRSLNRYHMYGLLCCIIGITMVGSASLMSGEGSSTMVVTTEQMLMGMGLIIASQAVQAAQITFEDFFMADMDIAPMKIVGYEGLFGVIGTVIIMAPIVYYTPGVEGEGFHEDFLDTVTMIANNPKLQTILAIDMVALLMYNISGMMVTCHIGAVFRTVLETLRTLFVWLVDLALFYGGFGLGESWSVWSWLQLAGFFILVAGTLVYNQGNAEDEAREVKEAMVVMATEEPMAEEAPLLPGMMPATVAVPMAAAAPTQAIPMAGSMVGSFKATQTINAGSFHRGSLAGSLPRSLTTHGAAGRTSAAGDRSFMPGASARSHVVTHGAADSDDE